MICDRGKHKVEEYPRDQSCLFPHVRCCAHCLPEYGAVHYLFSQRKPSVLYDSGKKLSESQLAIAIF